MSYGIIEYDQDGKPVCEICKKSFHRVISHVRQKHNISERDYKLMFGFDLSKGICSIESKTKSKNAVLNNYEKCIGKNLLCNGEKTRYIKGSMGRTKDKVSEQTRIRLINNLKTPFMIEMSRRNGKKLGLSGLGNKVRWGHLVISKKDI